jgi:4-oxalocrotonate tautomerase
MPLVRISLRHGKPAAYRRAIADGVYTALRQTFNVPDEDRFITISEHGEDGFLFSRTYMGIERSDDLVIVQITVSNTRGVEHKKALFAAVAEYLSRDPGLRPQDVFINLLEVAKENWSFGNGIAQYAD